MVIPPYYFVNKMDDKALHDYYTKLADTASLPIILYNMPSYAGVNLSLKLVNNLSHHPNIIGIKDTGGSMEILWRTVHESAKQKFSVVAGMLPHYFAIYEQNSNICPILKVLEAHSCQLLCMVPLEGLWFEITPLFTWFKTYHSPPPPLGTWKRCT